MDLPHQANAFAAGSLPETEAQNLEGVRREKSVIFQKIGTNHKKMVQNRRRLKNKFLAGESGPYKKY
jgi:hypothetical protein